MKKDKNMENDHKEDLIEEKIDENQRKTEALEEEVKSLKDTLLRKMAEMENLRKRLEKERDDAEKYANSKFAKDLLGVIDNFNRVSENAKSFSEKDDNLKAIFEGVDLCGKELVSVLKKHGIFQVGTSKGDSFDPQYHQAMCEIESKDHRPGSIIEVFQDGYVCHERLLRPSMVSVAKK